MARITKAERETIITFNEHESIADIETYNARLQVRLEELAYQYPLSVKKIAVDCFGCSHYTVKKHLIYIRKPY